MKLPLASVHHAIEANEVVHPALACTQRRTHIMTTDNGQWAHAPLQHHVRSKGDSSHGHKCALRLAHLFPSLVPHRPIMVRLRALDSWTVASTM